MSVPICKECAQRRYRLYTTSGYDNFANLPFQYRHTISFKHKSTLDEITCRFVMYGELPFNLNYIHWSSLSSYIRHCIILAGHSDNYITHEINQNTIGRVIVSPLLTLTIARKIGQRLAVADSMDNFRLLLRHQHKVLFPDAATGYQSFWCLQTSWLNTQPLLATLEVYNPTLRYLRPIICHLLEKPGDGELDFILARFTPLTYPMFFRTDDPLEVAIIRRPTYVPILLKLNLFHAYKDYSFVASGRQYINEITQAQRLIKVPATPLIRAKLAVAKYYF